MASSTIVDTDIIIDVGRGIPEAVNCLQRLQSSSRLAISVVTQMELIVGCTNKSELRTLEKFLQQFDLTLPALKRRGFLVHRDYLLRQNCF